MCNFISSSLFPLQPPFMRAHVLAMETQNSGSNIGSLRRPTSDHKLARFPSLSCRPATAGSGLATGMHRYFSRYGFKRALGPGHLTEAVGIGLTQAKIILTGGT